MKHTATPATLSPERVLYLRQTKRQTLTIRLFRWGFLLFLLLMWEVAARLSWIDSFIFSQPSRILHTYMTLVQSDLAYHTWVTLGETLAGFLLGAAAGVLLAILLWWSPFVSKVSEPYLVVLNSLPKIALGPVIIILAGAGTRAIVFMALAISLVVTVLEMLSGFRDTDPGALRMARSFGATKGQLFRKIVLPYNIPTLFDSLKVNIGLSLVGVIAGEFLVSRAGLGYLIVYGGQVFKMDLVMASVIILAMVAALLYESVSLAQRLVGRRFGHN
ncbi:MAG: ABC transporter permease [Clostridia bacterium]|nr:ABC transporter permease [Clostridia bacterium]